MQKVYLGMKVNYLTVIDSKRIHKNDDYKQGYYLCKCECGNIKPIKCHSITTGKIRDCGCGEFMRRKHIGKKYGFWEVIDAFREVRSGKINIMLKCKCVECGKESCMTASSIKDYTFSVCNHNKRGYKKDNKNKLNIPKKLRDCWKNIINRCYDESSVMYSHYGARGISMCEDWHKSLKSFADWALNNGYKEGLTIERIDFNKNYCPENCCWIPKTEQSKNTTRNRIYCWQGKNLTVAEIARLNNVSQYTLYCRLNKGMSIEDAVYKSTKIKNG